MKNKRVKQMMADVVMQGRKVFWFGEDTEIFLAPSKAAILEAYPEPPSNPQAQYQDLSDSECELITGNWRYMWRLALHEKCTYEPYKGRKVYNSRGKLIPYYEYLPLLSGYSGRANEIVQLSSSYT